MTNNIQAELKEHLEWDEKILWAGKPKTSIVFGVADLYLIPFSILWCGFVIFIFVIVLKSGGPFVFFVLPFLAIGLTLVFGRFIIDVKKRKNTIYGLTKDRILIKSGVFSSNIKSINIKGLIEVILAERKDGTGTISLGNQVPFLFRGTGLDWWPGLRISPELKMIADARSVFSQIIEIQNNH